MALRSYRDLRVWQEGMVLVQVVYGLTKSFPSQEVYGLCSQLQRSIVSVPSNIAEGYGRQHRREYLQHLSVAQGSLAEVDTQIEIAARLGYIGGEAHSEVLVKIASLRKQLYSLRRRLATSDAPPTPDPEP